jgi:hypothetical protein
MLQIAIYQVIALRCAVAVAAASFCFPNLQACQMRTRNEL